MAGSGYKTDIAGQDGPLSDMHVVYKISCGTKGRCEAQSACKMPGVGFPATDLNPSMARHCIVFAQSRTSL